MSKSVFVVQQVWSDGEEDDLTHYGEKSEAIEAFDMEVKFLTEEWGDCEDFKSFTEDNTVFRGQDAGILKTAVLQFSEHEVTVYLKEMPLKKEKVSRFFAEKWIEDEVNLTEKEYEELDNMEYALCNDFGLGKISGGYVTLTIVDIDEELLQISIERGIDGERSEDAGDFWFNRTTMKIED